MLTLYTEIDDVGIDINAEDGDALTNQRAFIEVLIGEELFCKFEVLIVDIEGPDGKRRPVAKLIETGGNFKETKN